MEGVRAVTEALDAGALLSFSVLSPRLSGTDAGAALAVRLQRFDATEVPDRERPTRTPAPTTRPVATPGELESVTVSLSIEALGDRRALLTWSVSSDRFVARWEVVVTSGDRSRVIAVLRDPSVRELQVERLENPTAAYAVRARASGGAVLGQSNGVRFPLAD